MDNIERIIEYIKAETEAKCKDIARNAAMECDRILAESSRTEQGEYWKAINAGTKETEKRLKRLNYLAYEEAEKQVAALHQEMLDEAFSLAAVKLGELPEQEYAKLLGRLSLGSGRTPEEVVSTFKGPLSLSFVSMLFE